MNSTLENRNQLAEALASLDEKLKLLRVEFEQYFSGIIQFQPDKLKSEVEREFRQLLKMPLKSAEMNFRVKSLKYKYNTLDSYWRRVLREKEEGRYHKDVFKAGLRRNNADQVLRSQTKEGAFDKQLQSIYQTYKKCLLEAGHEQAGVSFEAFKSVLVQRASSLKKNNPDKKVQFSLVLKNGLPSVEASLKEAS